MSIESELTTVVLNGSEERLKSLNNKHVSISEINELYKPRVIDIVHTLVDGNETDLSIYDELLTAGNKIFRPYTCDGDSCLYVLQGPKKPKFTKNEIAISAVEVNSELGEYPIYRSGAFEWTGEDAIIDYCSHLYDVGTITGPSTEVNYSGALTPLQILNKIQEETGGEFQYVYQYVGGVIKRYINFLSQIGSIHTEPIELGFNATEIDYTINETDVRIGAGPIGKPSSSTDEFHKNRKAFENLAVVKGSSIPQYYTKDDNGDLVPGPNAYAPYTKNSGERWVVCDEASELIASYQEINAKEGGATTYPRLWTFESSEANAINMYWDCVETIREHLQPRIDFSCTVQDLKKLNGDVPEYYNTGDVIYVRLAGRSDAVQCRITKTVKDPREPENDSISIQSFKTGFMASFFKSFYKSPGSIDIQ